MSETKKKVVLETLGNQFDVDKITKEAVNKCKKENKVAIKDINVYVKPEDGKAYYSANSGSITGSMDI